MRGRTSFHSSRGIDSDFLFILFLLVSNSQHRHEQTINPRSLYTGLDAKKLKTLNRTSFHSTREVVILVLCLCLFGNYIKKSAKCINPRTFKRTRVAQNGAQRRTSFHSTRGADANFVFNILQLFSYLRECTEALHITRLHMTLYKNTKKKKQLIY